MIRFKYFKALFLALLPVFLLAQSAKKDFIKLSYAELADLYFNNEGNPKLQIIYNKAYMSKANGK